MLYCEDCTNYKAGYCQRIPSKVERDGFYRFNAQNQREGYGAGYLKAGLYQDICGEEGRYFELDTTPKLERPTTVEYTQEI